MSKLSHLLPFLDHFDGSAAIIIGFPFDNVHERSHKQDASSADLQQVRRVGWVRYLVHIEAVTEITHGHFKAFGSISKRDPYLFFLVKFITVLYRISDRLADREING